MSCGLECVLCVRWAWKRLTYICAYHNQTWPPTHPADFEPIPHICQIIMAIYDLDLSNPKLMPAARGYTQIDSGGICKRTTPPPTPTFTSTAAATRSSSPSAATTSPATPIIRS